MQHAFARHDDDTGLDLFLHSLVIPQLGKGESRPGDAQVSVEDGKCKNGTCEYPSVLHWYGTVKGRPKAYMPGYLGNGAWPGKQHIASNTIS